MRRLCAAATMAVLLASATTLPMAGLDPGAMLRADEANGVSPYAFYVAGTLVVPESEAAAYEKAARRAFEGIALVDIGISRGNGAACVAISATTPPSVWQAMQAVWRVRSALGIRSRVAVCLTGYTNESVGTIAARSLVQRLSGGGATAAVRENGEVYLGMPWIPIVY